NDARPLQLADALDLCAGRYLSQRQGRLSPGGVSGDEPAARELFQTAIRYAEESHYIQVKGKAIGGLAELDRQQQQWLSALALHEEAIGLLEGIAAQCDLAEAYLQQGLTYRAMEDDGLARGARDRAFKLFEGIGANLQLNRVNDLWHTE
ncbi:MAG: hypothetical protein AAGE92_05315, partial [Cyanobacteria bacterium P01_G01_bin.4]